jgi:hypothetical protein
LQPRPLRNKINAIACVPAHSPYSTNQHTSSFSFPFLFFCRRCACARVCSALFKKQNHQYYISLSVSPLCCARNMLQNYIQWIIVVRWYSELPAVMLKEKQLNSSNIIPASSISYNIKSAHSANK